MGGEASGDGAAGRVVEDGGWPGPAAGELGSGAGEVSSGSRKEGRVGVAVLAGVGGDAGEGEVGGGAGAEQGAGSGGGDERRRGRAGTEEDERRRGGLHGTLSGDPSPRRSLHINNMLISSFTVMLLDINDIVLLSKLYACA